ncbi:MAG TPA: saccharopine dehydrogenase, partial [Novosphingobium sp.]|nr:saccharopine dehydrogenase [Novosphingobium sp.]
LADLATRAKVVLTTVGPSQLYGEALVAACAATGTDYADLCGEPLWMRAMIDRHEDAAKPSGARICFSCGFDSIPFELGGRVRAMKGGFSGGTAASLKETMAQLGRDPALIALLASPFALTPGFTGPDQPKDSVRFDEATQSWATPFIMAPINTKNVHRANALLGHAWGADFTYDELLLTGPGDAGEQAARFMASAKLLGTENDPQPGEGPSKEERESGFYDVLMIGEMPDGRILRLGVKGRYDPGYGSTSRMLAETGMALLDHPGPGGIWTPGALLGEALAARLAANAEITFAVEE